jgi:hypothetical protein
MNLVQKEASEPPRDEQTVQSVINSIAGWLPLRPSRSHEGHRRGIVRGAYPELLEGRTVISDQVRASLAPIKPSHSGHRV